MIKHERTSAFVFRLNAISETRQLGSGTDFKVQVLCVIGGDGLRRDELFQIKRTMTIYLRQLRLSD